MTNKVFFPQQIIPPAPKLKSATAVKNKADFNQVLAGEMRGEIKFSKHAEQRIKSRNIELSETDMSRIQEAVGKARAKGARDSLILLDRLALVVSVKNNTVITAVDETNLQENVFTNIDSAVII